MKLRELLSGVCEIFEEHNATYALIGGYSAVIYGSPYVTTDIDFVVDPKKIDFELLEKLKAIGLEPTENYDDIEKLRAFGQFVHKTGMVLHIFPEVSGFKLVEGIQIEVKEFDGKKINVCSPEDYLIMRASVWYEEDKLKAIILIRAHKDFDIGYLMKRAKEENVTERIKWIFEKAETDVDALR
ncbi:MAG: hypothetical protein MSIBF_01410 [Candidatus Altiarchaeales archaeon IMC4]|nr:MAG: hypothetical protein MSIBF_01410 [Candidatus Altiarchaeales archaeon IMC4]